MKNIVGGYRPSKPEQLVGIPHFKLSNTLKILGANNITNEYTIPNNVAIFDQGQL